MIEGDAKGDTTGFILLLLITQVNHHYWSVYGYDRHGCRGGGGRCSGHGCAGGPGRAAAVAMVNAADPAVETKFPVLELLDDIHFVPKIDLLDYCI